MCLHIRNSEKNINNLRGSEDFKSYEKVVNFFSNKKISIVLTGNKNKKVGNFFKKFKNVIDYRNSKYQTIVNDLYLANHAMLFITQISGPIMHPIFFGKPFLGLDLVTFEDIQLYNKGFYLPKKFYQKNNKKMKYTEIFKNSLIFKDSYFNRDKFTVQETNKEEKFKFVKFSFNKILNNDYELNPNQNKYLQKKLNIYSNFITLQNINKIFFDNKNF